MRLRALADWLDSRTGFRAGAKHLLDEPLPTGVGWWFVTGSVLLFLLVVQFASGIILLLYYVPAPEAAYDSVRFIMEGVTFGAVVRGLHYFGASFIVIAAVIHVLRVVLFGSYKTPREVTWITGVVLLLIILAFALSGYLLPWDQKGYWATTVTINIARSGPFGDQVAGLLRGGSDLGALTLVRWYAAHVFLLPAALAAFVVSHLYLMRRHGISGPLTPRGGASSPFYPYHALKDTIAAAVVFALLLTLAVSVPAPLDEIADPTDATYVPRPEWYFLALFQLLKYFPGPLEPVATLVMPGLFVLLLFVLPFLDRGPERRPGRRPRVMAGVAAVGAILTGLTALGLRDTPVRRELAVWTPVAIAGREFARDERCVTCHRTGAVASPIEHARLGNGPDWLVSHVRDPEVIAAGLRQPPSGGMSEGQARAILAYVRKVRAGAPAPSVSPEVERASLILGRYCVTCHMIDGEGGSSAPDLSSVGQEHDAAWLRMWIASPEDVDPAASMPPFAGVLADDDLRIVSEYLATRR